MYISLSVHKKMTNNANYIGIVLICLEESAPKCVKIVFYRFPGEGGWKGENEVILAKKSQGVCERNKYLFFYYASLRVSISGTGRSPDLLHL